MSTKHTLRSKDLEDLSAGGNKGKSYVISKIFSPLSGFLRLLKSVSLISQTTPPQIFETKIVSEIPHMRFQVSRDLMLFARTDN